MSGLSNQRATEVSTETFVSQRQFLAASRTLYAIDETLIVLLKSWKRLPINVPHERKYRIRRDLRHRHRHREVGNARIVYLGDSSFFCFR